MTLESRYLNKSSGESCIRVQNPGLDKYKSNIYIYIYINHKRALFLVSQGLSF